MKKRDSCVQKESDICHELSCNPTYDKFHSIGTMNKLFSLDLEADWFGFIDPEFVNPVVFGKLLAFLFYAHQIPLSTYLAKIDQHNSNLISNNLQEVCENWVHLKIQKGDNLEQIILEKNVLLN